MPKPIKRGPASFQIKVRRQLPDGSVTNINKTFDTYEAAQKAIDVAVGKVSGDVHVDKRIERGTSFNDLLERYRDKETAKRPEGHPKDNELSMIRKWQKVDWVLWPLTSIESPMIAEWRDERVDEGQAPTTISNPMNLLSKIFKIAKAEWGLKVENPVSGVARPEKREPREVELRERAAPKVRRGEGRSSALRRDAPLPAGHFENLLLRHRARRTGVRERGARRGGAGRNAASSAREACRRRFPSPRFLSSRRLEMRLHAASGKPAAPMGNGPIAIATGLVSPIHQIGDALRFPHEPALKSWNSDLSTTDRIDDFPNT